MDCAKVRERLSCYVDGVLDERTLELIEAHLDGCAECGRELASLRALVETAGRIEAVEPPVGLKGGIMDAVGWADRKEPSCKQVAELTSSYVDGELATPERRFVAAHVADCAECAEELRAVQTLASVAAEIDTVEPPAHLRAAIADATTNAEQRKAALRVPIAERVRELISPRALRWVGGAAAAAVVVAFGVLSTTPNATRQLQQAAVESPRYGPEQTTVVPAVPPPDVARPIVEEPVSDRTAPRRTVRRSGAGAKTHAVVAVTEEEAPVDKPVVIVKAETVASGAFELHEDSDLPPTTDEEPTRPVEVAAAPKPAPVIKTNATRSDHPTLIKVASAPVVSRDEVEEWLEQAKAQAAMRSSRNRSGGLSIISARF